MNRLPFIAELHDIGKLVDWDDAELGKIRPGSPRHTFHNFDFSQLGISQPTSPSWLAQWSDSIKDLRATGSLPSCISSEENKACVFLTNIADVLAASISRTWGKKGRTSEGVYVLWNPSFYDRAKEQGKTWVAFRTPGQIKEMFGFIDSCMEPQEFLDKYMDPLLLTPEDKSAPLNFIPLRTHLELTGKIFRVLRYHSRVRSNGSSTYLEYDGQRVFQVQEAAGGRWNEPGRGKWIFRICKCSVRFPQSLVRIQDLNVLELRRRQIEKVVYNSHHAGGDLERQPYAVLFHTHDFLCLFLPKENHLALRQVLRPLWEKGFWIECEELEAELNLLTSTGERTRMQLQSKYPGDSSYGGRYLKLKHIAIWPELATSIEPPLCDLCQQHQGQEFLKDQVREWLCPSCREIRELGEPASAYAGWEETGCPAAWLKVSLDQNLLFSCLRRLFEAYVDAGPGMDGVTHTDKQHLKQGFRPLAAQIEFGREYKEFLQEFRNSLENLTDTVGTFVLKLGETLLFPIAGYLELTIIRLDSSETLGNVLDLFVRLLRSHFPECVADCPIRISVSLGNPKYPYHEHWSFFSRVQQPGIVLCIQQPGTRQIALTVDQYEAVRRKLTGERLSHFLHRLAAIETEGGEMVALVQALEQRQRFPQIHELMMFHRLSLHQILDFYRLVSSNMQQEGVLHV
jgi:hypothetical protein